jgi:hypothetical protein
MVAYIGNWTAAASLGNEEIRFFTEREVYCYNVNIIRNHQTPPSFVKISLSEALDLRTLQPVVWRSSFIKTYYDLCFFFSNSQFNVDTWRLYIHFKQLLLQ